MTCTWNPISPAELQTFYRTFPAEKTFLQLPQYGEMRAAAHEQYTLWGAHDGEKLIGTALIQLIPAKRSRFLHVPHGPLILPEYLERALPNFLRWYKAYGREQSCDFVRISPLLSPEHQRYFAEIGFRDAAVHLQNPEKSWVLDITPSEETLLANMRKSTRYEIRRIEKTGIQTRQGNTSQDLEIFWAIHLETVKRQGFVPFARQSTEAEMTAFGDDVAIFSAEIEGKYLASSIILYDDYAGYYHQGASIMNKAPVAYATLWAAILEAKKRGCKEFNFWGVSDEDDKKHPWYGLSYFKRGFGGEERNYVHAQDYALTGKYRLNRLIEKYRRFRRGY